MNHITFSLFQGLSFSEKGGVSTGCGCMGPLFSWKHLHQLMAAEDTIAFGTSISACNSVGYWPSAWRLLEMMHFSALEVTFAAKTQSLKDLDSPKMTVFLVNCPPFWRLDSQSGNLSWLLFPFFPWGSSNLPTKGNMKMPTTKTSTIFFCSTGFLFSSYFVVLFSKRAPVWPQVSTLCVNAAVPDVDIWRSAGQLLLTLPQRKLQAKRRVFLNYRANACISEKNNIRTCLCCTRKNTWVQAISTIIQYIHLNIRIL